MSEEKLSKTDQILDLLLEVLLERQQEKQEQANISDEKKKTNANYQEKIEAQKEEIVPEQQKSPPLPSPQKYRSIHLERTLGRLALILAVLVIVVNIPFNRYGTSLARAMPDQKSLIVRDGLVLKGSEEKIFVLENNKRRWITTLDAFKWYGYRWEQVNEVEDKYLEQFAEGPPIFLLLKCASSPHVYALEDGKKRWIKDIPTFESRGFVWQDIKITSCTYLRDLPDGVPIPPEAGKPPQP